MTSVHAYLQERLARGIANTITHRTHFTIGGNRTDFYILIFYFLKPFWTKLPFCIFGYN